MDSSSSTYHQKRGDMFFGTQCSWCGKSAFESIWMLSVNACPMKHISAGFITSQLEVVSHII